MQIEDSSVSPICLASAKSWEIIANTKNPFYLPHDKVLFGPVVGVFYLESFEIRYSFGIFLFWDQTQRKIRN